MGQCVIKTDDGKWYWTSKCYFSDDPTLATKIDEKTADNIISQYTTLKLIREAA